MWNNRCYVPLSHCLWQRHPLTATGLLQISWLRPWSVCLHVSNCDLTDWVHALTSPWRDFPTSIQCTSATQGEWSDRCGRLWGGFLVSSLLCVIRRQLHPNTIKNPAAADKGKWQAWAQNLSICLLQLLRMGRIVTSILRVGRIVWGRVVTSMLGVGRIVWIELCLDTCNSEEWK